MHTRSSSTRPTRRRGQPRISFAHHPYLLAACTIGDGSGPAVRRAGGQVAVDETNAGSAYQRDVQVRQERLRSGSRRAAGQGSYQQHADPGPARHEARLLMWEGFAAGTPVEQRPSELLIVRVDVQKGRVNSLCVPSRTALLGYSNVGAILLIVGRVECREKRWGGFLAEVWCLIF